MKYNPQKLKRDLITKRCINNDMTMAQACQEIGISKATLSRLEKSKVPDVETLAKVCEWLKTGPNDYFEIIRKRQDGFK